ncbi:hypothetical protein MTKAM_01940 [Moorella thermoacetica]
MPNEEVYRWYKTCDLVLNLSNLEAFGLNVIEGLAAGKPVLVNNKTALAELSQLFDGVTSVNACSLKPEELASYIMQCITEQSISDDLGEYKWEGIAQRYLRYYYKKAGKH